MSNIFSKYKQFFLGLAVGAVAMVGFALYEASKGEPFESVTYAIREVKADTLVQTPKFRILYRGVSGVNAAGSLTIAGKRGDIAAPWSGGYGTSWGGSETGIDHISLYDAYEGVATMYVAGQLFRVMDNATKLKVANLVVDLGTKVPLVVVEKNKLAHMATASEEQALLKSIVIDGLEYDTAAPPKP